MREVLDRSAGVRLSADEYRADFRERFWQSHEYDFWKLERRQTFAEPGDESWVAFSHGDWETALRLIAARRPQYESDARRMAELGFASYRVRVVEAPLTPYLQWELRLLRLMGATSDRVRVLDAARVGLHEASGPLPEVVTLGADVTYEVLYDDAGLADGAIRHTGAALTAACRQFIARLYESGEDVVAYVDREVAALPPPVPPRG
ncbi:DUF6879 family protein [Catenuloplanes atrovinosus]|uniref:DUF6879 domain-containing protein n=1 Tax=Catenuloplanes atrovinosus TaxID=137266 RepID=A0AAE4CAB7_9ACTN|nr:DUF6879 family protein [Catenuloplanes atrovinosus]MDR7277451.1 hypothetical protein [Catenuloplanes atrovinosus]